MLVQIFGDIRRPLVHCIAPTHAQQGLWLIVSAVAPAAFPSHRSWIERKAGSALAFACNGLCNRRTHTNGVVRPWANIRGFVTLLVCRRSGPLSSAGITQLPRCRVGGGALDCSRAGLRPPLKLDVQFSRIQLSRRRSHLSDNEGEHRGKVVVPALAVRLRTPLPEERVSLHCLPSRQATQRVSSTVDVRVFH